jgi:cysteine desulfuration protein SufE
MTDIDAAQAEIAEEFALFGDWSERYQYLIDLAKTLTPYPEQFRDDAHLLRGCQSQVFVHFSGSAERLEIHAISDSSIVSGLIALVLRVYAGRSAAEIVATEPSFIDTIGLNRNLSITRKNGLSALIAKIKAHASAILVCNIEKK